MGGKFDWRTIFLKDSGGLSSKRVLGVIGFIVSAIIFVFGFITQKEIPGYGELFLTISASLVGLDSITGIWNKSVTDSHSN